MLKLSAQMFPGVKGSRLGMASQRIKLAIPKALTRIVIDAEKQLKTDYLQRGGTFTRTKRKGRKNAGRAEKTKTSGFKWVKNPGKWLRVGTGALRRSWLHVAASVIAGGWQASIVSRGIPYARIHEFGGMAGRGRKTRIPKRAYLAPMFNENKAKWISWIGHDLKVTFR